MLKYEYDACWRHLPRTVDVHPRLFFVSKANSMRIPHQVCLKLGNVKIQIGELIRHEGSSCLCPTPSLSPCSCPRSDSQAAGSSFAALPTSHRRASPAFRSPGTAWLQELLPTQTDGAKRLDESRKVAYHSYLALFVWYQLWF